MATLGLNETVEMKLYAAGNFDKRSYLHANRERMESSHTMDLSSLGWPSSQLRAWDQPSFYDTELDRTPLAQPVMPTHKVKVEPFMTRQRSDINGIPGDAHHTLTC
jgi:hypothetical protein